MSVSVSINSTATLKHTKSSGLPTEVSIPYTDSIKLVTSDGTTSDKADRLYFKELTLAASATDLDLQNLTDVFGDALSFADIVWGRIANLDTTNPLTIGGTGTITNAWTAWLSNPGTITLRPKTSSYGSWIDFGTGVDPAFAVDATHKVLRLDPGANTINVVVILAGRSA